MFKIVSLVLSISCAEFDVYHQNNVLGSSLKVCSEEPMTGYTRDGRCAHIGSDYGTHTVCAEMTAEFLEYTKQMGNNLSDPAPMYDFPGLNPGDRWCLCSSRWMQAHQAGKAPNVILEATNESTVKHGVSFAVMAPYRQEL